MSQPPGLSLEQLVAALQRKGIPLAYEMGTFLVLEACERVLPSPVVASPSTVWLSEDGEVLVAAARPAQSDEEACRALVLLLGDLLVRSAPGVPQMLLTLVEHGPSDGEWSLTRLRDDLEASLVPLNRAATRRVLARLLREIRRDRDRGAGVAAPDSGALDSELDALLGVEEGTAPIPPVRPPAEPAGQESGPEAGPRRAVDGGRQEARAPTPGRPSAAAPTGGASRPSRRERWAAGSEPSEASEPAMPTPPPGGGVDGLDEFERVSDGGGRRGTALGVLLILIAAGLLVAYFLLGREESLRLLGLEGAGSAAPARESAEPAESPEPTAPVQEYGTLRVSSAPAHAQVLMRVGDSPALIEQLPVGVAHEFVALAEGHVPSRAVVPADASWQQTPDGRRIELALQLEPTDRAARAETLGATKLPRDPGTPGGELGSVRVVTSPPGAQVYQLIGFTPDVEVENLLLDRPVELALFLGGHRLERVTVGRESYADEDGRLVADLDVKLSPR